MAGKYNVKSSTTTEGKLSLTPFINLEGWHHKMERNGSLRENFLNHTSLIQCFIQTSSTIDDKINVAQYIGVHCID